MSHYLRALRQRALLRGKKSRLTQSDFIEYFGKERLKLTPETMEEILSRIRNAMEKWVQLIQISFLSDGKKKAYLTLLEERTKRLNALFMG